MTPPKEYFEQVPEGTPGAQRVGPYWFSFVSENALYDLIKDGALIVQKEATTEEE